jgi:ABC-type oligopeptide transport system substrate-binding subunit
MKRKLIIFFGMVFVSSFGATACSGQESKEKQSSQEEEPKQETMVAQQQPEEKTVVQKETKVKVDGAPSYDKLPEEVKEKLPAEVEEKIQAQQP